MTEKYEPYPDEQALAGPDRPAMKTIMDLIRYCITVHFRFGNTCVADVRFKWGANALTSIYESRRQELKEGREHLTVTDEFQSDKYPWCPAGFVPLKVTDPLAMDLLSQYAYRRKVIDAEFSRDLLEALVVADTPKQRGGG